MPMKVVPQLIRHYIETRPHLVDILHNIKWLLLDKLLRLGFGLVIGVLIARSLGPEQFGQLNFATALVGLFGTLAALGFNVVVVRDLVGHPDKADSTIGTAFLLHTAAGILSFMLVVGCVQWLRPDDGATRIMVTLLGVRLVLDASAVFKYWFEAQVQSRYTVWVENSAFLCMSAVRILFVIQHAPAIVFAGAILCEAALVAIGMFVFYKKRAGSAATLSFDSSRAKALLTSSWPVLLSGLAIVVYMKIDLIMIGQILGNESVGIYAAAVRISEATYFIPIILVSSLFPHIIKSKKESASHYSTLMSKTYRFLLFLALILAIPIAASADLIIGLIFGETYSQAADILRIHVWAGVFVFIGVASSRWLVLENLQRYAAVNTTLGAIINVGLNLLLIEPMGPVGAAWATLVSYSVSAYFALYLHRKTRPNFWNITKSALFVQTEKDTNDEH